MSCDLHLHTHYSDGTWSPAELVEQAFALKLSHIAITDHDTMDGIKEASLAAAGRLEIIPGIELSTVWRNGTAQEQDVHILGYYVDSSHSALKAIMASQQQARRDFADAAIAALMQLGIELTMERLLSHTGKGVIGRPHVTRAIVEAGGAESIEEAWGKFMQRQGDFYIPRQAPEPEAAIKAINLSGGVASLAHPGKTSHTEQLVAELKAAGLSAIEVFHRSHSLPKVKKYMRLATANQLIITGGSDCHGPLEDYPASIGSVFVPVDTVRVLKEFRAARHLPDSEQLLQLTGNEP